jgi:hypothetical protein
MSTVLLKWDASRESGLEIAPARLSLLDGMTVELVAAVHNRVQGRVERGIVEVSAPGFNILTRGVTLRPDGITVVHLHEADMIPLQEVAETQRSFRVDFLAADEDRFPRYQRSTRPPFLSPTSRKVRVASLGTPNRTMNIPPEHEALGPASQLVWKSSRQGRVFPLIEPVDPRTRLLLAYLLQGDYAQARAAADAFIENLVREQPLLLSAPSYTQLVLGYAYGLGGPATALAKWCRRTEAAAALGADGMVLAALSASRSGSHEESISHLVECSKFDAPVLWLGTEIGIDLAETYLTANDDLSSFPSGTGVDVALKKLIVGWRRVQARTDPASPVVSIPPKSEHIGTLSHPSLFRRFLWTARYLMTRYRFGKIVRTQRLIIAPLHALEDKMQESEATLKSAVRGKGAAQAFALGLLLVAVLALLVAAASWMALNSTQWLQLAWLFVSAQLILVAGWAMYRSSSDAQRRIDEANGRRQEAEMAALSYQDQAMRGRALAAALMAQGVTAEKMRNTSSTKGEDVAASSSPFQASAEGVTTAHAAMARELFGDLV